MSFPELNRPPAMGFLGWIGLLVGWLIPGAGFMIVGRWRRGLLHLIMVGLTFGVGLALHSAVTWPTWSIRSEEFNLINNFTFIVQMGCGIPSLASFLVSTTSLASLPFLGWFGGIADHPHYELGSYFLIVAGALNYFAMGNFYDRIIQLHPRFLEQETGEGAGKL